MFAPWKIRYIKPRQHIKKQRHHFADKSCYCSVTKSCPTLWPHGLQQTRLPCSSLSPGVCPNSYPSGQWCHPTISKNNNNYYFCFTQITLSCCNVSILTQSTGHRILEEMFWLEIHIASNLVIELKPQRK